MIWCPENIFESNSKIFDSTHIWIRNKFIKAKHKKCLLCIKDYFVNEKRNTIFYRNEKWSCFSLQKENSVAYQTYVDERYRQRSLSRSE